MVRITCIHQMDSILDNIQTTKARCHNSQECRDSSNHLMVTLRDSKWDTPTWLLSILNKECSIHSKECSIPSQECAILSKCLICRASVVSPNI